MQALLVALDQQVRQGLDRLMDEVQIGGTFLNVRKEWTML